MMIETTSTTFLTTTTIITLFFSTIPPTSSLGITKGTTWCGVGNVSVSLDSLDGAYTSIGYHSFCFYLCVPIHFILFVFVCPYLPSSLASSQSGKHYLSHAFFSSILVELFFKIAQNISKKTKNKCIH